MKAKASNETKVLILDDHEMVTDGFKSLIEEDGMTVIGTARNKEELLGYLVKETPTVLVLDISLSYVDEGIDLAQEIKQKYPVVKILALSMHKDALMINRMFEAGAEGYILKEESRGELLNAINALVAGGTYYQGVVFEMLRQGVLELKEKPTEDIVHLTKREKEVLKLIAEDHTSSEISGMLNIEETTVNTHRKNMISKLGVKSSLGLVRYAVEHGYLNDSKD